MQQWHCRIGAEHASWLNVGVSEFRQSIFEIPDPRQLTSKAERDRERFRVMAARTLLEIEDRLKNIWLNLSNANLLNQAVVVDAATRKTM